jgi:hypothetical protein
MMKTTAKIIALWADVPSDERVQLEDQIMERALMLWHKKGHAHRNALNAWLQAEREILAQKEQARFTRSWKLERASLTLKRTERRIKIRSETFNPRRIVADN